MQPNPTPQPTDPAAAPPTAPPATPEQQASRAFTMLEAEPPAPPVATFPTPSSPPNALKEMQPARSAPAPTPPQEKDLHDTDPRAVTVFGLQCWVIGHCLVARSEFSALYFDHDKGEVNVLTKDGGSATTGLSPKVFAGFLQKASPIAIVTPGE
jgi:hypothetical protein